MGHPLVSRLCSFALTVKNPTGGLKDWKASRQREVSSLRAKRAAAKAAKREPPVRREASPRINVHEQLQKAYEIAFAAIRADRSGVSAGHAHGTVGAAGTSHDQTNYM